MNAHVPRTDRAVSPVIGAILLVATTVIMAAVIGSFVLGIAGGVKENVQAGVTLETDPVANEITVVWTTNQNADEIEIDACSSTKTMAAVGESTVTGCPDQRVSIVVTGISGEDRTVLISKTLDLRG